MQLLGVVVVVIGLMMRFNPLVVVIIAGFVTGICDGMSLIEGCF